MPTAGFFHFEGNQVLSLQLKHWLVDKHGKKDKVDHTDCIKQVVDSAGDEEIFVCFLFSVFSDNKVALIRKH